MTVLWRYWCECPHVPQFGRFLEPAEANPQPRKRSNILKTRFIILTLLSRGGTSLYKRPALSPIHFLISSSTQLGCELIDCAVRLTTLSRRTLSSRSYDQSYTREHIEIIEMDKLRVHHGQHNNGVTKTQVHHGKGSCKRRRGGGGKGIKVVYISSPMKLTASAEEFRAVVQELTGRYSNVADHDAPGVPSYFSSSSSSYSYGRASPTTTGTSTAPAAAQALPPTTTVTNAGAITPPFQSMYDQTGGAGLLYGQDYYW
ncbi:hypothetical protein QYE76_068346 [Lolium multiflorum]|uniref:VQ domain-containing protein n=1 Tax=Lolium multiflorum TaxID=4521 RepID=A0AAD8SE81_LOLMU|nr:hypothetical protein QYE76_068346 [Lolium multiflorum]